MGWSLFSWLFGEKEESPPEQLVLGAELECPYGTEHSFLIVQSDDMDINGLPEACVLDREKSVNIMPFGKCQYFQNYECESFMVLDEKWENPEPQAMQINGEEIITTKSTLICMASGKEIKAVTSGQDGIVARRLEKEKEIDEKYPNLRARLMDPNGSLYLDGEMYKEAIRFIEDCVDKHNGELRIADIFDESDLEMVLIRTALGKLIPSCDERRIEKLIDGLEIRGTVNDMDSVPGWDPHLLNEAMVEMLKRDSAITAELVETKSFYEWQEKNMQNGDELAESTMKFAHQALAFYLIMASAPAWELVGFGGASEQTESEGDLNEWNMTEDGGRKPSDQIKGNSYDINKLWKTQPHTDPSEVSGLKEQIIQEGPNSVKPIEIRVHNGKALVVEGHHRLEAFRQLGYDRVPIKYLHKSQLGKVYADGTYYRSLHELLDGYKISN